MGTWSAQLDGNDFFVDVYETFNELRRTGKSVQDCSNEVMIEFLGVEWDDIMDEDDHESELIEFLNTHDDNDEIEFFLALACAQLDAHALHPDIYQVARLIVQTGASLRLLRELDADEEFLAQRRKALDEFLSRMNEAMAGR